LKNDEKSMAPTAISAARNRISQKREVFLIAQSTRCAASNSVIAGVSVSVAIVTRELHQSFPGAPEERDNRTSRRSMRFEM
jgi:hypothetical protein